MSTLLPALEAKPLNTLILLGFVIYASLLGFFSGNFAQPSLMMLLPLNLQSAFLVLSIPLVFLFMLIAFIFPNQKWKDILEARKEGIGASIKLFLRLVSAYSALLLLVVFLFIGILLINFIFSQQFPGKEASPFAIISDFSVLLVLSPLVLGLLYNLSRTLWFLVNASLGKKIKEEESDFSLIVGLLMVCGTYLFSTSLLGVIAVASGYIFLHERKTKAIKKSGYWQGIERAFYVISALYLLLLAMLLFENDLRQMNLLLIPAGALLGLCNLLFFILVSAVINKMEAFRILLGEGNARFPEDIKKYVYLYEVMLSLSLILLMIAAINSNWFFVLLALINVAAAELTFQDYVSKKLGIKDNVDA